MSDRIDACADAIVVAAGASRRMGGIDKTTAPLLGRPLLSWSLAALSSARSVRRVIVVAAPERVEELRAAAWVTSCRATIVPGGARRQESVAAGVRVSDAAIVLVHDGARPLVSPALADDVAAAVLRHGAALPVVPVAETLKRVLVDRVDGTVDREGLVAAQTPQGARRDLLLAAYERFDPEGERTFTDEAALLEAAGFEVATVPGQPWNLKVTVPEDLARAEAWLRALDPAWGRELATAGTSTRAVTAGGAGPGEQPVTPPDARAWAGIGGGAWPGAGGVRVGHGTDAHPFGPGLGLALGGIEIADAPRLHGHSDGDVALHAIADALLGAAGLGDLGRLFPAGDPATRGIASGRLLRAVVERLAEAGWRPDGVDVTIVAGRPRLGARRLDAMRESIGALLGIPAARVGVKASTGNLSGYEGAGRGVAATAVATVVEA